MFSDIGVVRELIFVFGVKKEKLFIVVFFSSQLHAQFKMLWRLFQNKVQNKPMLMGATVGEGVGYVWADHPNPINNELYSLSLQITFKARFLEVLSVYPPVVRIFCIYLYYFSYLYSKLTFNVISFYIVVVQLSWLK